MRTKSAGFSLIEIMMVLIIIGVLMSFMFPRVKRVFERASLTKTQAIINRLKGAIQEYRVDTNKFPTQLEALVERPQGREGERWRGPYLEERELPEDSWGHAFEYNNPPVEHKDKYKYFEIISRGPTEDDRNDDVVDGS